MKSADKHEHKCVGLQEPSYVKGESVDMLYSFVKSCQYASSINTLNVLNTILSSIYHIHTLVQIATTVLKWNTKGRANTR